MLDFNLHFFSHFNSLFSIAYNLDGEENSQELHREEQNPYNNIQQCPTHQEPGQIAASSDNRTGSSSEVSERKSTGIFRLTKLLYF